MRAVRFPEKYMCYKCGSQKFEKYRPVKGFEKVSEKKSKINYSSEVHIRCANCGAKYGREG